MIHCSIVLYKKEALSTSKDKRNRSLLDNKTDFFYNKPKNKRSINIRININNNRKKYLKLANKPLTSSTSGNNCLLKMDKKKKINSTDKIHKKINKNNSVHSLRNNSFNFKKNSLNSTNYNNEQNLMKKCKNKKKEIILKKRKYGEIIIDNNNIQGKNIEFKSKIDNLINLRGKTTKNKNNNIIIYNNLLKKEKNRKNKYYSKIEKFKIDSAINKTVNLGKININKNSSHSNKRKKNTENNISKNNISNLSKRRNYIVPLIKVKKRKKGENNENELEEKIRNESNLFCEDSKQLFMSHLIESKQIEYLKDYEKYRSDSKGKLLKNNEKKIKAINDENLIDKIMSSDEEENKDTREDNEELTDKKEIKKNHILKNKSEMVIKKNHSYQNNYKNKQINIFCNQYSNYNIFKNNNENKMKLRDIIEEENKNNEFEENYNHSNDNENNNILIYNLPRPKINSLEYIYRINNNIDVNKLITSLSYIDFKNNDINKEVKENDNIINNDPDSQSSLNILYEKKNLRPKDEINDFMKTNRLKFKINEIKLKKEKKDEIIKKFRNFVELQKNIEENKKAKLMNKSAKLRNSPLKNDNKNNLNNIKNNSKNDFHLSQNTSLSSTFNLQEFYLSIYDAQNIFTSKENTNLLKNHSMIFDNEQNRKFFNISNDLKENKEKSNIFIKENENNKNIINNQIKEANKKFDKNALKKIKNVINRLNNFINNYNYKKEENSKENNNDIINDYNYLLKKLTKSLISKNNSKIRRNEANKSKLKNDDFFLMRKQIPRKNTNFKKISMNEIKKLINNSQNNMHINKYKLSNSNDNKLIDYYYKEKKSIRRLNKNYSGIIRQKKSYNFTDDQLNKYKDLFTFFNIYFKLFIQKKVYNIIIFYTNIKNKYISGFNKFIYFIKKRPFNYLRIIQQREYYQVILRQFYLPYLNRAFNSIKIYAIKEQKFSGAFNIIYHVYYIIFLKRLLFFIERKEDYNNKKFELQEKIIEEEKDELSYESSSKTEKKNNGNNLIINKTNNISLDKEKEKNTLSINDNYNDIQNSQKLSENELIIKDNNNISVNEDSIKKENSESYDEVKIIKNTFNTIINNISHSPKIFVFNLLKNYYLNLKEKIIIKDNENKNKLEENNINNQINNIDSKDEISFNVQNDYSNDRKYNTYLYESLSEKSSLTAFPNSEGNDRLHKIYIFLEQNKNKIINNSEQNQINNKYKNEFNFQIERQVEFNNIDDNNTEEKDKINKIDRNKENVFQREYNDKNDILIKEKKEEMSLFIPYKGEVKKNLMNNLINYNKSENNEELSEDLNFSEKIFIDEFKKYEQNKEFHDIKEKKEKNINNNDINSDKHNNTFSEDIYLPFKNPELNINKNEINNIKEKNEAQNKNINDIHSIYFNLKKNLNLKTNENDNIKRYTETEDLINNNFIETEKIIMNIPNELEEKITEDLTNEIINELFKTEVENKGSILCHKKHFKKQSNSSITGVVSRDSSMSVISNSPGRKYNKSNSTQNLVNNNESYSSMNLNKNNNIQDEDALNSSIFKKTVYEIKKDKEYNYYENYIFPELLNIIEKDLNKNYISIINNLRQPLKKDEKEIITDLSSLISFESLFENNIIKYNANFYNEETIVKKEYINKKLLNDFNKKLKNKSSFYEKYYYKYLNQCIYDAANDMIKNKRIYGIAGEPLSWSLRDRKIDFEYKNTKIFKNLFITNIINELKKLFFSKIGSVIENTENLNISQFSKERDIKFNENIKDELKQENEIDKLDEQETVIKITISKIILSQLLNEVIEILEHIQYSRTEPEKYNYKSIFSCINIPLLSFQNIIINNNNNNEDEEKYEDKINQ